MSKRTVLAEEAEGKVAAPVKETGKVSESTSEPKVRKPSETPSELEKLVREMARATSEGFKGFNNRFEAIDTKLAKLETNTKRGGDAPESPVAYEAVKELIAEQFAGIRKELDELRTQMNSTTEETRERRADATKLVELRERAKGRKKAIYDRIDAARRLDALADED